MLKYNCFFAYMEYDATFCVVFEGSEDAVEKAALAFARKLGVRYLYPVRVEE